MKKVYSAFTIVALVVSTVSPLFVNHAYAANLWSDGFESNNLSNWTSSNGVWAVQNGGTHNGSKKVEAKGDTGSNPDYLQKSISTLGQQNVVLKYWYKIAAGLESNDHIIVEWSTDGTTWNQLADYSNINSSNNYVEATHVIAGATNQSGFRFRFSANMNSNGDQVWIDDVSLTADVLPIDICPNVLGVQETGACADQTCVGNGGTWNNENQTCDMPVIEEPVVDPIVCDAGFHLVDSTCVEDEVVTPPTPIVQETATIYATKIICNNESDLPNWGNGGPYITANTATDFLGTHSGCRAGTNWNFEWAPESASNPGDNNLGFSGGMWTVFGPTDANGVAQTNILTNASVWIREVLQNDYINYSGWIGNGENTPSTSDEVSAEIYCDEDVYNYDNFDFISINVPNKTYYCVAFNAPKTVTPPTPVCTETQHLVDNVCVDNVIDNLTNTTDTNNGGSSGGNGGMGGRRHDVSGISSTGGQVLGASTCDEYLKDYIKLGRNNDTEEVKKLQEFLNEYMGAKLPVTGFYGSETFDWVKKFQSLHNEAVLIPWAKAGKPTDGPTGYVYKTTKRWINIIKCPEMITSTPIPTL